MSQTTNSFKAGDVVLGAFATANGQILNHYSVVLTANSGGCVLVYTTSLKEHSTCSQRFTAADMMLANWSKPCRWDASNVSIVPNDKIRKTGSISKATLNAIRQAHQRALESRTVHRAMLTPAGEVVTA